MKTNTRGEALTIVLLAVVLLGGGAWGLSKTKWFHGESKRAATSTSTTSALVDASNNTGAAAAAYVSKIGEANASAPASRERDFIGRAVPIALGYLPKPDPMVLLEAERLKVAVLEGRLAEANAISGTAMKRADEYQRELAKALAAKRASDLALEQAAAEARGAEQQAFWAILGLLVAGGLYAYTKLTHLSPGALAEAVQTIRTGSGEKDPALQAIDTHTSRLQQLATRWHVKLFH